MSAPHHPPQRRVEVRAPATVANLGPGFDILGMALAEPFDTVIAEWAETPGVIIGDVTGDGGRLPREAGRNTAGIAAQAVLEQAKWTGAGVRLSLHKGLPLASGLGSSAASAAGAAVAVNALLGGPLSQEALVVAGLEGEAAVSGRHADNIAPALLGGIVLITGLGAHDFYHLPVPANLYLALVTPAVEVPTAHARAVLPESVPLPGLVRQAQALALLVTAIHRGDVALMGRAMERDSIVEPARRSLMPGLCEVRAAARECGAFGTIISGAGPTLCSICDSSEAAARVADSMRQV
ncbi:MAG: homoserine kinase, partial [Anaerolineae bacterium]|nr:homoserine kinase [Anaerolineae bacterium]